MGSPRVAVVTARAMGVSLLKAPPAHPATLLACAYREGEPRLKAEPEGRQLPPGCMPSVRVRQQSKREIPPLARDGEAGYLDLLVRPAGPRDRTASGQQGQPCRRGGRIMRKGGEGSPPPSRPRPGVAAGPPAGENTRETFNTSTGVRCPLVRGRAVHRRPDWLATREGRAPLPRSVESQSTRHDSRISRGIQRQRHARS